MAMTLQVERYDWDTSPADQLSPDMAVEESGMAASVTAVTEAYGKSTAKRIDIYPFLIARGRAKEVERWGKYVEALAVRMPSAKFASSFWNQACATLGAGLVAPVTVPGEDGSVHLAWDFGYHYFDIDLFADGSAEWFYRDRSAGIVDGGEVQSISGTLTNDILRRLKLVAR